MLIPFFALIVFGAEDLVRENAKLSKTNAVLLNTLRGLMAEKEVGEELVGQSVKATCPTLTGYKACTGTKHELDVDWSRAGGKQIFTPMPGDLYCQLKCENMGIPGCCEWQWDNEKCYFTAFSSSTIGDSGSTKLWGSGLSYTLTPTRSASICSVSSCVYEMQTLETRWGDCSWDYLDKDGQRSWGMVTVEICNDLCLNDPACVFAATSSSGSCHTYKTCNLEGGSTGWISAQKVCKGAVEYCNHPDCTLDDLPVVCIPPYEY